MLSGSSSVALLFIELVLDGSNKTVLAANGMVGSEVLLLLIGEIDRISSLSVGSVGEHCLGKL